jgi:hypothetical protein
MTILKSILSNRWTKVGLILVALGWGPLFAIILLSRFGMLSDPNPNPIGYGLLFAITFFPAIICLAIGSFQSLRRRPE